MRAEVRRVSEVSRLRALEAEGLLHPRADAVTAELFADGGFFLAADKVQVKYEMLRAHLLDGVSVTAAAAAHGYSRAGFYLVAAAFEQAGMGGLLDDKRGRRGPVKLTAEIVEFLPRRRTGPAPTGRAGRRPVRGGAAPAHRRAGPAAVSGRAGTRSPVLAAGEAAQADYETLRARVLATGAASDGLAAARFARRGLAGLIAWPSAEPVFAAELPARPAAMDPARRPRLEALAAGFEFLLDTATPVRSLRTATVTERMIKRRRSMRGCPPSGRRRGTIGSQLAVLRETHRRRGTSWSRVRDDGSGARLDRPGLDELRDAAEAGLFEWCGACRRTGLPASTPTRCWSSTSWPASGSRCGSPTPHRSTTTRRPGCSPRSRA